MNRSLANVILGGYSSGAKGPAAKIEGTHTEIDVPGAAEAITNGRACRAGWAGSDCLLDSAGANHTHQAWSCTPSSLAPHGGTPACRQGVPTSRWPHLAWLAPHPTPIHPPCPQSLLHNSPALPAAKRVLIVPGYGLAVANAQYAIADLVKGLKKKGIEVK